MNGEGFLTALWGPKPPGFILTWQLSSKASSYLLSPAGASGIPVSSTDVYTGVATSGKKLDKNRRTTNQLAKSIAGVWADIDVNGGPDQKTGAAETKADAIELASSILEPTIIVDSGYGIQAWWLFDGGPWEFKSTDDQQHAAKLTAQWQKLHRDRADFGLDYTHDLARVMRLPGTMNGKGGERVPVFVLQDDGPRHERDDLFQIAAQAGPVDPGYATFGTQPRSVNIELRAGHAPEGLAALLKRSPAFTRAWEHQSDLPSMSERDLAVTSIAALAGWTDQQLADLIAYHRQVNDPADPKGQRQDYVVRTIAKVRDSKDTEPSSAPLKRDGTLTASEWGDLIRTTLDAPSDGAIALPFDTLTSAMDGGLRPGDLCLVAGWTSHGKSVLVDQIADRAAADGSKVHLYLTEMTAYQRGLRVLARLAGIKFSTLKRRELDQYEREAAMRALTDLPYGCSIVADWTVEDVVAHMRENAWDLAVVDLIHGFHYQDERDLSKTSSVLVRAAKASAGPDHAGTAIVAAAHLNDGQMRDQRSAKRPRPGLHSIKGSSSLKQDADVVMFVHREDDADGRPTVDGSVWLAKCRDGELAGVDVQLDVARMEFVEVVA